MLKPGQYPTLRWSLFCGEPLPVEIAEAWAQAAPNSVVENLYGPTELTIACALYRWNPHTSPAECERGSVPIGYPYPGMEALLIDENGGEAASGQEGELLMTGPQVSLGYWRDPEKNRSSLYRTAGQEANLLPNRGSSASRHRRWSNGVSGQGGPPDQSARTSC